jgi:glycosyltransferase involved in cell wall biosynthesis
MNILLLINGSSGLQYHRQTSPHVTVCDNFGEFKFSACMTPELLTEELLKPFDAVHVLREVVKSRPRREVYNRKGQAIISNADGDWLLKEDQRIIDLIKNAGKKLIFDIDDNWQLPSFHGLWDSYRAFAVEKRTLNVLRQADLVTTTTKHFADHLTAYTTAPVVVLPNTINKKDDQWKGVNITSSLVRFGWIGGTHHREDIKLLQVGINRAYRELADFQFCLSFDCNDEYMHHEKIFSNNYNLPADYRKYLIDQLQQIRVAQMKAKQNGEAYQRPAFAGEHYSYYQPYRRLWSKGSDSYGTLYNEIDVSLVPLRTNNFNKFKSELKLVEAGAMGKAAIVTRVKPYDHFPEDCVYFVNENDMNNGWLEGMEVMMCDETRERYASNLAEYCHEHYNADKVAVKRYEEYQKLLG